MRIPPNNVKTRTGEAVYCKNDGKGWILGSQVPELNDITLYIVPLIILITSIQNEPIAEIMIPPSFQRHWIAQAARVMIPSITLTGCPEWYQQVLLLTERLYESINT
jgi:hypothetical protein